MNIRHIRLASSAVALAAAAIGASAWAATTATPSTTPTKYVATSGAYRAFGGFSSRTANSLPRLKTQFGPPTTIRRSGNQCTVRWVGLGLKTNIATIGSVPGDPCVTGYVLGATLSKSLWKSRSGARVGAPIAAARTACETKYTPADCAPVGGRYPLQYQRTDCEFNPGRFIVVYAKANALGRIAFIRATNLVCD